MAKNPLRAAILLVFLVLATTGHAATMSWILPVSYADGSPIDPSDVKKILVKVYTSPEKTGPWKWVAMSLPGATSVTVMDPPFGHTLWYTATATLDGAESEFAEPVSKINLIVPILPFAKKVMWKMLTVKKMTALFSLLVGGGLVWYIRHRGKKGKG